MAIVWSCIDCGWMPIVYSQCQAVWKELDTYLLKKWKNEYHSHTHVSPSHPPLFPCLRASEKGSVPFGDTDFGSDVSSNWTPILNPLSQGHKSTVAALSVNNWIHIHLMVHRWSCITTFSTCYIWHWLNLRGFWEATRPSCFSTSFFTEWSLSFCLTVFATWNWAPEETIAFKLYFSHFCKLLTQLLVCRYLRETTSWMVVSYLAGHRQLLIHKSRQWGELRTLISI